MTEQPTEPAQSVENSVEMCKTLLNKTIDNVDNINYNRGINIKRKEWYDTRRTKETRRRA